ncbi:MAG TPA: response regulator [Pyrinomonadaceae bacterium]|nr:response regulator [Pyrinomonadaceae bacterium]
MLAGRKLLLADDSATIQKVIDLTFADEGVQVVSVSSGQEAINRLLETKPDVVLADVFMPSPNGYEVCEYVKTNEQFKHIPVVLLVGSFEPFDEAEARRVGADDILTKPFQSMRRLIDRVGALVSSPSAERESPTLELPHTETPTAEEERMDTHELEVTTADTLRLDEEQLTELQAQVEQPGEEIMETGRTELTDLNAHADQSDVLLDLGEVEAVSAADDDFVLELDDDVSEAAVAYEPAPAYEPARSYEPASAYEATPVYDAAPPYESAPARAFVEPQVTEAPAYQPEIHDSFADTQEVTLAAEPEPEPKAESVPAAVQSASASLAVGELSPEMIDAIARRAVELMSDKVIREIAWEVVPDLAELLIKKQLEETK